MLYLLIVLIGWVSITAASYNEEITSLFSFSHFYIKQAIWVGLALIVALFVLLIDSQYYHRYAYPLYLAGLGVLLLTLVAGSTKNGAKAWFELGSFAIQPIEFVKIATALALARLMSEYSFSITKVGDIIKSGLIICAPLLIVILQNDTGSGIVLGSFLMVFYREGLNKWLCIPIIFIAALFLLSFLYSPTVLLVALLLVFSLSAAFANRIWRHGVIYLALLFGSSTALFLVLNAIPSLSVNYYIVLLSTTLLSMVGVCIYAYRARLRNLYIMVLLFVVSVMITPTSNAMFDVLKPHQQNRIKTFLGITDDASLNYNVRQSKIAIGSGGFLGKGYLQGSHIRYGLVPEKHTDFIFCTIGEEFGFVGAFVVLMLILAFIFRLMRMGDNQRETFGRVYCYIVASILLFHTLINVGMTIGVVPVMGIPLPLISYGGSSLLAFSVMIFIAFAFDAQTTRELPTYSRL